MQITCTIQGLSPLLMNRFTDAAEVSTTAGHRPAHNGSKRGTPREQAELTAYKDDKGRLYVPGTNIFAALIEAGKFHKLGRNKVTTIKTSLVPAALLVTDMVVPLKKPGGRVLKTFEVDSRRVVIPATGGSIMRHRARCDKWEATFKMDLDEGMFSPDFARVLVDDAGKKIGIGDYRPQRKGPFGRFVVTGWTVEE